MDANDIKETAQLLMKLKGLVQEYHAILANAWPGNENEKMDEIQKICDELQISVSEAFELNESPY